MKVLKPSEVQDQKRLEEDQKVQKAVKLHELVREEELALNRIREDHRQKTEQLATNFLAFSKEIDQRKQSLNTEIAEAEARKQKALEPLDKAFAEAQQKAKEVKIKEEELNLEAQRLKEEKSLIQEKEKELDDKRKDLRNLELQLATEQEGLATTKKETIQKSLKLDRDTKFFLSLRDKIMGQVEEGEMSMNRQKAEIETRRKLNEEYAKQNEEERQRLFDRKITLDAAFKELQQKQNE